MSDFRELTKTCALTDDEIEDEIEEGLLDHKVKTLLLKSDKDGNYVPKRAAPGGSVVTWAKLSYFKGIDSDSFYLNDFYLVCCLANTSIIETKKSLFGEVPVYSEPDQIVVVPLKDVNYIGYVHEKDTDKYDLVIEMQDCEPYIQKDFVKAVETGGKSPSIQERVDNKNQKAKELTDRAKTLTAADKLKIVMETKQAEVESGRRLILICLTIIAMVIYIIFFYK